MIDKIPVTYTEDTTYCVDFYNVTCMNETQAYSRGLHQGFHGQGPFGVWYALEHEPTPIQARIVSQWLRGWAKGRTLWLEQHPNHENP